MKKTLLLLFICISSYANSQDELIKTGYNEIQGIESDEGNLTLDETIKLLNAEWTEESKAFNVNQDDGIACEYRRNRAQFGNYETERGWNIAYQLEAFLIKTKNRNGGIFCDFTFDLKNIESINPALYKGTDHTLGGFTFRTFDDKLLVKANSVFGTKYDHEMVSSFTVYLFYADADFFTNYKSNKIYKALIHAKKLMSEKPAMKTVQSTQPIVVKIPENELLSEIQKQMVLVEGGTFMMGCSGEDGVECIAFDQPTHAVKLNTFYISKFEITQDLYYSVMGNNPSTFKECHNCPVEEVSWKDAQSFISKLNLLSGKRFRLPTEAEFEYAARGGKNSMGYKYSGGDKIEEIAWYEGNSGWITHPIGLKRPNELGLYDMSGNVEEWCGDWFGDDYYKSSSSNNPTGPLSGTLRMVRGSSYSDYEKYMVVSRRFWSVTGNGSSLGFRLVEDR